MSRVCVCVCVCVCVRECIRMRGKTREHKAEARSVGTGFLCRPSSCTLWCVCCTCACTVLNASPCCFRTVAAAVSASFLTQSRFQLSGAFAGIPYMEAQGGVVSRRRMPRVRFTCARVCGWVGECAVPISRGAGRCRVPLENAVVVCLCVCVCVCERESVF